MEDTVCTHIFFCVCLLYARHTHTCNDTHSTHTCVLLCVSSVCKTHTYLQRHTLKKICSLYFTHSSTVLTSMGPHTSTHHTRQHITHSMGPHTSTHNTRQHITHVNTFSHAAVQYRVCVQVSCSVRVAVCCGVAVCVLQHTATHFNTLQGLEQHTIRIRR